MRRVRKSAAWAAGLIAAQLMLGVERMGFAESPPSVPSEWAVVERLETSLVRRLAANNRPVKDGALGRNRARYFSVVFQRGVTWAVIGGVRAQDVKMAEAAIHALEYAFEHQNGDGSFQCTPPADPADKKPNEGDLASAAAFFYSELGHSLLLLKSSEWFQKSPETADLRARLDKVKERANVSLTWLTGQEKILRGYDQTATNRYFFDAMAYYLTGKALGRPEAMKLGEDFARRALKQQDEKGFFTEKGGYDSSYQGVSVLRALIFYVNLDPQAKELKEALWKAIEKAVIWEAGRIQTSGEVSVEGNTRVHPGGEKFLGREKDMAYVDVAMGFYYYCFLTNQDEFREMGDRVVKFYVR